MNSTSFVGRVVWMLLGAAGLLLTGTVSYRRHRFPPIIIQHAVWLYLPFHAELSGR